MHAEVASLPVAPLYITEQIPWQMVGADRDAVELYCPRASRIPSGARCGQVR
jgi:hypothetical protein